MNSLTKSPLLASEKGNKYTVKKGKWYYEVNEVIKKVEQNKELWKLFTKKEEYNNTALLDRYEDFLIT